MMIKVFKNRWFLFLVRLILSAVFIYAGAIKFIAPQGFADSIATFRMVPSVFISIVALAIPPLEIIIGGLLLAGSFRRQAAASIFVLAVVFAIALGQALIRGIEVDCGCFGSSQPGVWSTWLSLGRALLILVASGWLYNRSCPTRRQPRQEEPLRVK